MNPNIDNRRPAGGPGAGRWMPSYKPKAGLSSQDATQSGLSRSLADKRLLSTKSLLDNRFEIYALDYAETTDGFVARGAILSRYYCPYCGADLDCEFAQEMIVNGDIHDLICTRCDSSVDAVSVREYLVADQANLSSCIADIGQELIKDRDRGTTNRDDGPVQERVQSRLSRALLAIESNPSIAMHIPMMWLEANGEFDPVRDPHGITVLLDPKSLDVILLASQTEGDETAWADAPLPASALRVLADRLEESNASYLPLDELELLRKRMKMSVEWMELKGKEDELDAG